MAEVAIRITVKATNAILAKLADDCGGVRRAATQLGVCEATFSKWLHFHSVPSLDAGTGKGGKSREKIRRLVIALERETGRSIFEIFPALSRAELAMLSKAVVQERVCDTRALLAYATHTTERLSHQGADPLELLDMREKLAEAMTVLTPRQRRILQMRYGLDGSGHHSLAEISAEFKVSRERIRQIEAMALRQLLENLTCPQ